MADLHLESISKYWHKDRPVLQDINLDIPDGEFWVLVGPSGCGKSTILRLIAGLETPSTGSIFIGDRLVNQVPPRQRDVAMVFQNYALYPHMTVAENLAFGLKMGGMDAKTIQERTLSVARSLKIDHLLQRKPAQLSGGQQQRVALGRAIIRAPQIFLMDEPLSNLDAQLRDSTRAELKILHQHIGITTVYVTHDQTEAMTLADKIVVLDRGKVQQVGTPLEVYQNPANLMVASFLGNPPMNIFSARWQGGRLWMGEQSIACCPRWDLPEQVTVGVRPEAMQWSLQPIDNSLPAEVILLEPLGSYTIVRLCLVHDPQQTLLLPLPSSQVWNWRVQTPVWLVVPEQAIYLFCPQTGERYP